MNFNEKILQYFRDSSHVGEFPNDEKDILKGEAGTVASGEKMQLQLKINNNKIIKAKFKAYGSVVTIAAMAYLAEWLENKKMSEVKLLTIEEIMRMLPVPETKRHCILLAYDALQSILIYNSRSFLL